MEAQSARAVVLRDPRRPTDPRDDLQRESVRDADLLAALSGRFYELIAPSLHLYFVTLTFVGRCARHGYQRRGDACGCASGTYEVPGPQWGRKRVWDYLYDISGAYVGVVSQVLAVEEFGKENGRLHYHLILCAGELLRFEELGGAWSWGRNETLVPDSRSEAAIYTVKYTVKDLRGNKDVSWFDWLEFGYLTMEQHVRWEEIAERRDGDVRRRNRREARAAVPRDEKVRRMIVAQFRRRGIQVSEVDLEELLELATADPIAAQKRVGFIIEAHKQASKRGLNLTRLGTRPRGDRN